ncbi:MAG: sugar transferase [Clostridia bacterium]|nr:sugar transferase [Clostridia bacterium]
MQDIASMNTYATSYRTGVRPTITIEKPDKQAPAALKTYTVERVDAPSSSLFYKVSKRLFDIVFAVLGLTVTALPMLIIAIAVACDSKGGIIFRQERLGKDGKPFIIHKFRSMRSDAEACGAQWADADDPRVTRVGKFLRASRLDELPQLYDILVGNMSLIGPRPERACFYEQFETYIDGFSQRLLVKPGLTGLAQVNGGYDLLPEEKIVYDVEYIKNHSLAMDIKIILKTIAIVFTHDGAR